MALHSGKPCARASALLTHMVRTAGMLQFKPIFLGQDQPKVKCATTTQKCVRTNDIENVGVTKRHHTFFEMLGNFSFGDYFKHEACMWAWELSTEVFQLPKERVFVSVFEEDDDAFALWRDVVGAPLIRSRPRSSARTVGSDPGITSSCEQRSM